MTEHSILASHDEKVLAFNTRFVQVAHIALSVALLVGLFALLFVLDHHPGEVVVISVGLAIAVAGAVLARWRTLLPAAVYSYLVLPALAAVYACFGKGDNMPMAFLYSAFLYPPTAFIARPATPILVFISQAAVLPFLIFAQARLGFRSLQMVAIMGGLIYMVLLMLAIVLWLFARQMAQNNELLRSRIHEIEVVSRHAASISEGDLSVRIEEEGFWAQAFRSMIERLKTIIRAISQTTLQINAASEQILTACQHQQKGATEQSSAVEEIRQTMEALVKSSQEIAKTSKSVTQNADNTLKNNERIEERIHMLSEHTKRIGEILEIIQDIANKSDLLALNASLEGTRAGEAGRGFALVAAQMQRLAENVMASVKDIKALTVDIFRATNASVLVTEEGTKMAGYTAKSAQQINLISQQQQGATEQVWRAIEDILLISRQTAAGSEQTLAITKGLTTLSEQLQALVEQFKLGPESAPAHPGARQQKAA